MDLIELSLRAAGKKKELGNTFVGDLSVVIGTMLESVFGTRTEHTFGNRRELVADGSWLGSSIVGAILGGGGLPLPLGLTGKSEYVFSGKTTLTYGPLCEIQRGPSYNRISDKKPPKSPLYWLAGLLTGSSKPPKDKVGKKVERDTSTEARVVQFASQCLSIITATIELTLHFEYLNVNPGSQKANPLSPPNVLVLTASAASSALMAFLYLYEVACDLSVIGQYLLDSTVESLAKAMQLMKVKAGAEYLRHAETTGAKLLRLVVVLFIILAILAVLVAAVAVIVATT